MLKKSKIIDKLNKLATKLDELGMISEADRIDTISKLLAPGERWSCPVEFEKENPGDIIVEWLEEKHEKIIEDLKSDLEKI